MSPLDVLIRPVLTEKTNWLREGDPKVYVFQVDTRANKHQVEDAVRTLFGVSPESVRILVRKGKPKRALGRRSGRVFGQTSLQKRAYVKLAKGQKIDKFEGV